MATIKQKINQIISFLKNKLNSFSQTKFMEKVKKFFEKGDRKFVLQLYLIAIGVFFATLITNELTIVISGDFYLQEIPFYYNGYDDWWTYFKTGEFPLWDESAFLGVNNLGANAFYYLWNIFFLPVIILPRVLVPQGLAILIMTKFVLAGFVMKKLLNYIGVSEKTSKLVSMAYAFSGWSLYYLWFNHFLDITILLPLVLLGLEKLFKERKVVYLNLSLFLSAITNYYFFIMICFTTVIYAVFRFFHYVKTYKWKDAIQVMLFGVISYVIAISMALIVLIPCFSVALESSRVDMENASTFTGKLITNLKELKAAFEIKDFTIVKEELKQLFELCFKFDEKYNIKNYTYPIVSFFYPPSSCYDAIIYNNNYYDNANSSLFMYTPLMLMLIPSLINSIREKKVSHLIGFAGILVMLFTPFCYYCFTGFTTVCYGRWELFVVVVGCMYIATTYDKVDQIKKWYLDISIVITLASQAFMLYIGHVVQGELGTYKLDGTQYYAMAVIAWTIISYCIIRKNLKDKGFFEKLNKLTIIEILLVGNVCVICQGIMDMSNLYGGYTDVRTEQKLIKELNKEDLGYFRIFNTSADRDAINMGMIENYRGQSTFHSIYNYNLQDFIDWSRISYNWHGWSMGIHEKRADLDTFTNVKYYVVDSTDNNVPFGYEKIKEHKNKVVYENKNFIEFGFAFDTIISDSNLSTYDNFENSRNLTSYRGRTLQNESNYVRYAILEDEIAEEFAKENGINYKKSVSASEYNKIFKVSYINVKDIIINRAIWDVKEQGKMDGYEEPVIYSKKAATALKWDSTLDINTKDYGIASEAKERGGAYVTVKADLNDNLHIELYGENENGEEYLLVKDFHIKHGYNSTSSRKFERGFYVYDQVTRIKIIVKDTLGSSNFVYKPDITYQYYDTFKENIDKLKENPIEDLEIGVNDFKFKTTYDSKKMVVLTIPYDSGWSLTSTDENGITKDVELVKAQGGFLSFVGEEGNLEYNLVYFTPGLKEGTIGLGIGIMLVGCLYLGFELNDQDKKNIKKQLAL